VILHPPEEKPSTAEDLEPTARNLLEARELASRSGAAFLAVMIDDRGPDFRHDRHLLQARLRELGVPWVAADNQLVPRGRWKQLRYPIDTHWSSAGHREVAEALAPYLQPLLAKAPG
jgi:lysophospholipase L1-like esterase